MVWTIPTPTFASRVQGRDVDVRGKSQEWITGLSVGNRTTERGGPTDHQHVTLRTLFGTEGMPRVINCDNGPEFTETGLLATLCWRHGVKLQHTEFYAPNQNAVVERAHGTLKKQLRTQQQLHPQSNWLQLIEDITMAYNVAPHSGLGGMCPYKAQWRHQAAQPAPIPATPY